MTNEEMKAVLAKAGVAESEIENVSNKFDAEKITEIVEAASTPKEAFEKLHAFYPELAVEEMQKQCEFIQDQFEAATNAKMEKESVELTENELEMVCGGGIGDWFKKNWKTVAAVAAVAVGAALVVTGVGCLVAAAGMALAAPAVGGAGVAAGIANLAFGGMGAGVAGAIIGGAGYSALKN